MLIRSPKLWLCRRGLRSQGTTGRNSSTPRSHNDSFGHSQTGLTTYETSNIVLGDSHEIKLVGGNVNTRNIFDLDLCRFSGPTWRLKYPSLWISQTKTLYNGHLEYLETFLRINENQSTPMMLTTSTSKLPVADQELWSPSSNRLFSFSKNECGRGCAQLSQGLDFFSWLFFPLVDSLLLPAAPWFIDHNSTPPKVLTQIYQKPLTETGLREEKKTL